MTMNLKKIHLRSFLVEMHNDLLNEAAYFLSKTDVTPNEEDEKKINVMKCIIQFLG